MTDRPDVDTLEAEIIGSLPRSVDDPAWESPTAAKVHDLADRARDLEQQVELRDMNALDGGAVSRLIQRAEAAGRLARRVAELEAEKADILRWLADALSRNQIVHETDRERARRFVAGDGGGA